MSNRGRTPGADTPLEPEWAADQETLRQVAHKPASEWQEITQRREPDGEWRDDSDPLRDGEDPAVARMIARLQVGEWTFTADCSDVDGCTGGIYRVRQKAAAAVGIPQDTFAEIVRGTG